jgi:RNA-splicing ligase RtcB
MRIPVRIYINENLISNMAAEGTKDHAINVSTLPGVKSAGVISPRCVGNDINSGVILIQTKRLQIRYTLKK